MSRFGKKIPSPASRRSTVRRKVGLTGSLITIHGAKSVLVEDLCPSGARLVGRRLPEAGEEILLRTSELALLGRIAWADHDLCGVTFEEGYGPSAGTCLALQLRTAA